MRIPKIQIRRKIQEGQILYIVTEKDKNIYDNNDWKSCIKFIKENLHTKLSEVINV